MSETETTALGFAEDSLGQLEAHPDYPEALNRQAKNIKDVIDECVLAGMRKPWIAHLYRFDGCGKHLTTTLPCYYCKFYGAG